MATSLTIAEQFKRPSMGKRREKMWCVRTRVMIQPLTRRRLWHLLQHGWALGALCSGKQARHERTNTVWFHPYDVPRVVKYIETESGVAAARCWGGERGVLTPRLQSYIPEDEKPQTRVSVTGARQCESTRSTRLTVHFQVFTMVKFTLCVFSIKNKNHWIAQWGGLSCKGFPCPGTLSRAPSFPCPFI